MIAALMARKDLTYILREAALTAMGVVLVAGMLCAQEALPPTRITIPGTNVWRALSTLTAGELRTAKLMRGKAQNPSTRAYATQQAAAWSQAQEELERILRSRQIQGRTVPELDQEWQNFGSELRTDDGATADRDYFNGEIQVARLALAWLQNGEGEVEQTEAGSGIAAAGMMAAVVPILERQRKRAEGLQAALAGGGFALGQPVRGAAPPNYCWNGNS